MKPIKITKDNFLWYFYCCYYVSMEEKVVHPKNLCNFFWVALCGLVVKIVKDWSFFLVFPSLLLMFIATLAGVDMLIKTMKMPSFLAFFLAIFIVLQFCLIIMIPVVRIAALINKVIPDEWWESILKIWAWFFLAFLFISHAFIIFNSPEKAWEILILGVAMIGGGLIALGLCCLLVFIFRPVSTTNAFKTTWGFILAVKNKVCPFVEVPEIEDFKK